MITTIALIDYGAGNLTSVRRGLRRAGLEPVTPATPQQLSDVAGILVPGVGHFSATTALSDDWRAAVLARVQVGVPLLGICLGMQWLFAGSTEAPTLPGLALAQGVCQHLKDVGDQFDELIPDIFGSHTGSAVRVPHIGWNQLEIRRPGRLLEGVTSGAFAYFAHSYAAPVTAETSAVTAHGVPFAAAIEREHVFGAQFHPELSAETGARVFANFAAVVRS